MSEPLFVDTGYLIGLLSADDHHHEAAVRWGENTDRARTPLVTSTAIFLELGNEFRHPRAWPRARLLIDAMRADPSITVVTVDDGLLSEAISYRSRYGDKSWGLVDCTSFVIMCDRRIGAALSCDKHFPQAGFKALLIEPK